MLINIKMPTLVEYLNINKCDKWVEHEQGSYRQVWVKFKDFSRTSKRLSYSFQALKFFENFLFKCLNSTPEMLDWDNGDISTWKLV